MCMTKYNNVSIYTFSLSFYFIKAILYIIFITMT